MALFSVPSAAAEPPPKTLTPPEKDPAQPAAARNSNICDCLVGYGAPVASVTRVAGATGFTLGGRGGAVLRHHFVLGAAGYGLLNNVATPDSAHLGAGSHNLKLGGAGFWFAYILWPEAIIHPTFGVLIGGGSVGYQVTDTAPGVPATYTSSSFFQMQPEVEADVNVNRILRVGVAVYYRFVAGVKLEDRLTNGDVGGPGASLVVKIGFY